LQIASLSTIINNIYIDLSICNRANWQQIVLYAARDLVILLVATVLIQYVLLA